MNFCFVLYSLIRNFVGKEEMSNSYFQFRQFTVHQERCAMKVGTDGCLLGAWARGGERILDVGTGTGVIALMMAQRFPDACVTAIDIDAAAVSQARENVAASPFAARIEVHQADFTTFPSPFTLHQYTSIISNPPYFADSLQCPDAQRTKARHTTSLSYETLMAHAAELLDADGEISVIVPFDSLQRMESAAALAGLMLSRRCAVYTTMRKPPRRYLLAFRKSTIPSIPKEKQPCSPFMQRIGESLLIGSPEYHTLLRDFYLKL